MKGDVTCHDICRSHMLFGPRLCRPLRPPAQGQPRQREVMSVGGRIGTWGIGGVRCRIRDGWGGAGRQGEAIVYFDGRDQLWVAVQWDDEDDPDIHKAAGLQVKRNGSRKWEDVQ